MPEVFRSRVACGYRPAAPLPRCSLPASTSDTTPNGSGISNWAGSRRASSVSQTFMVIPREVTVTGMDGTLFPSGIDTDSRVAPTTTWIGL